MTQYIKYVPAIPACHYQFTIILDHAPESGEAEGLEAQIQGAMEQLGVPSDQVGVLAYMSELPPWTTQEAEKSMGWESFPIGSRHLIFVIVRTEEGGFTEEPASVSRRAIRAVSHYSGLPEKDIAAVILENAHLEADWNYRDKTPMYDPRMSQSRMKIEHLRGR